MKLCNLNYVRKNVIIKITPLTAESARHMDLFLGCFHNIHFEYVAMSHMFGCTLTPYALADGDCQLQFLCSH